MVNMIEDDEDSKVYWSNDGFKETEEKNIKEFYNAKKFALELQKGNIEAIYKIEGISKILIEEMKSGYGSDSLVAFAYYGAGDNIQIIRENFGSYIAEIVEKLIVVENENKSIKDYFKAVEDIEYGISLRYVKQAEILYNLRNIDKMTDKTQYVNEVETYFSEHDIIGQKSFDKIFLEALEKAKEYLKLGFFVNINNNQDNTKPLSEVEDKKNKYENIHEILLRN